MAGTYMFFSPERFEGEVSSKSDIWAVGVTMYFLLSNGEYPFKTTGENFILLHKQVKKTKHPSLPESVSADLRDMIDQMLEKKPAKRPDAVTFIKMPFIWKKIMLIVEEEIYG